MPFTINLDGVEAWQGGSVLTAGTHNCHCIDAEEGTSSGGHPELHLTWEAMDGPEKGGTIQDWVQITGATLGKIRQMLEACQVPVTGGQFELSAQQFLGRYASVVVREKLKRDGTPRNEIVAYQRVSDANNNAAAVTGGRPVIGASAATQDPPF